LEEEALAVATATGADLNQRVTRRLADMRYIGQGSETTVALPETLDLPQVAAAFEVSYRSLFGRTPPGTTIQFVALRLSLIAPMPGTGSALHLGAGAAGADAAAALKSRRQVYFADAGGALETPVYNRYALPTGAGIAGPAVFEENESTFIIGPGSIATVLPDGSILTEMPT
jgi:N-methylhydantoinase A